MPFDATVYRVMIASPSDVKEFRPKIIKAMHDWNDDNTTDRKIVLIPIRWERHSAPQLGERPQELLDRNLVDNSDVLIAVFWGRLGSHTGKEASGTIEEIKVALGQGKLVMLYFCDKAIPPSKIDHDHAKKVKDLQKELQACSNTDSRFKGIYDTFRTAKELEEKLRRHLDIHIKAIQARKPSAPTTSVQRANPQEVRERFLKKIRDGQATARAKEDQAVKRVRDERAAFEQAVSAGTFHGFRVNRGILATSIVPLDPPSERLRLGRISEQDLLKLLSPPRLSGARLERDRTSAAVILPYPKEVSPDILTILTDRGSIYAVERLFRNQLPPEKLAKYSLEFVWKERLVSSVYQHLKATTSLNISGPFDVGITFIGMANSLAVPVMSNDYEWLEMGRANQDHIIRLDSIRVKKVTQTAEELTELLLRAYEDMWFQHGYRGLPKFDAAGNFVGLDVQS